MDSPRRKYRATVLNFRTVDNTAKTEDQALEAIQNEVVRMRQDGINRQVEAVIVLASKDSSEQEIRHLVYRQEQTTPVEVKVKKEADPENSPDQAAVEHILRVGPHKPLGYAHAGPDVETLKAELERKGLKVEIIKGAYSGKDIIIVYDEEALQRLLDSRKNILQNAGWPMTAREFALKVNKEDEEKVDPYTELFTLIADAFADFNNSGRIEI